MSASPTADWRRVHVVTDQSVNHEPHLEFVRAVLGGADLEVHHVFVRKELIRSGRHRELGAHLRLRHGVPSGARIMLFRDSECRCLGDMERTASDLRQLASALQGDGFRAKAALLSPFSEAAMLLDDDWLTLLGPAGSSASFASHICAKRAGQAIHKDDLELAMCLHLGSNKRDLNRRWSDHIRQNGLPPIDLPSFQRAVEDVRSLAP